MKIDIYVLATLVAAMLCSCRQHDSLTLLHSEEAEYVTFSGEPPADYSSKSELQTADEKKINNVQFVVYNSDGSMNGYGSSATSSCQVKITRGSALTVYAAVNIPDLDLSACYNESQIKSQVTGLSDNGKNNFHMLGHRVVDMSSGNAFSVQVSRFASKVSLGKVTKAFSNSAMNDMPMAIKGIYLINVVGACSFMLEPSASPLYHQGRYVAGEDVQGLFSDRTVNKSLDAAGSVTVDEQFYCYPNKSSRLTRLVVEVVMNSHTYYYPVDICSAGSVLAPNKHYLVKNLKITGLGSDDPDVKPSLDVVDFSVEVLDWDEEVLEEIVY